MGDRVATDLSWRAVVVGDALGALLEPPTDDSSLVVYLPDDQHRADDTGSQALQNNSLVVVNWNLGAIVGKGDGIRRRRWIIRLRRWWRGCVKTCAGRLVDVDDIHDERICGLAVNCHILQK